MTALLVEQSLKNKKLPAKNITALNGFELMFSCILLTVMMSTSATLESMDVNIFVDLEG